MRSRSPANRADSSPPSPAFTWRMTSLPSLASRGTSTARSRSSSPARRTAICSASTATERVSGRGDPWELLAADFLLAKPALEAGYPAAGVKDLLLARVERMAVRADIGVDDAVARCGPRCEGVPARAGHLRHHVVRV